MKIIAELGAAHNGSKDTALEIIRTVVSDIFKLQYWTPGTMAVPHVLKNGTWKGRDLVGLYEEAQTPLEWFPELFAEIEANGMTPMVSVFDRQAFFEMEALNCPMYKIASYEAIDLELVDLVAQAGKPVVISTGQLVGDEIDKVVATATKYGSPVCLMHCVSQYPAASAHLDEMTELKAMFADVAIGYSDHTEGILAPILAAQMGAELIEKHVCLDRVGLDGGFALPVYGFNLMYGYCHSVKGMLTVRDGAIDASLRRSIFYAIDLKEGSVVRPWHLMTRRPNLGLSPLKLHDVTGRQLNGHTRTLLCSVKAGDPVKGYHFD